MKFFIHCSFFCQKRKFTYLLTYLPLENWFGRQRYLRPRKDNPSMVDVGYTINNAIRNQKHFKPIANGNVADSGMTALTDEPIPS